jgi:hypothetical protein
MKNAQLGCWNMKLLDQLADRQLADRYSALPVDICAQGFF